MTLNDSFSKLVAIMERLRSPDGCPWDREQTHQSIAPNLIEEAYEVLEAIDRSDPTEMTEELGDLLLQVLFHAQIMTEAKRGSIDTIMDVLSDKLVRRHPHVFGESHAADPKEALRHWEATKQAEKKEKKKKGFFDGVPGALPALLKAYRLGEKASRVGFDWTTADGVLEKVTEESRELVEAITDQKPEEIEHEYGDLLFTLANLGRFLKLDPENALRKASARFIRRFEKMESFIAAENHSMQELTLAEWETLWKHAKKMP